MSAPLTPLGCDLRGLGYMPLDVSRLLDSDTVALTDGREFKAAFLLWARSWTQVPAASIPTDERLLCRMAGVSLTEWRELSEMALRGWITCDDGRMYHPVVAEKALRAWIERIGYRDRSARAQAGRHESFQYRADEFSALKREAAICLERLVPGSALEVGVVLDGDERPPSGSPARSLTGSEEKGSEEKGSEGEWSGAERTSLVVSPSATREDEAFALYQERALAWGNPVPKTLDVDRRKKLAARLDDIGGLSGWLETLDTIGCSPLCLGQGSRGWRLTFDWLMQPANIRKVRDGNFVSEAGSSGSRAGYLDLAMQEVAA